MPLAKKLRPTIWTAGKFCLTQDCCISHCLLRRKLGCENIQGHVEADSFRRERDLLPRLHDSGEQIAGDLFIDLHGFCRHFDWPSHYQSHFVSQNQDISLFNVYCF